MTTADWDGGIIVAVNGFVGVSPAFDHFVLSIASNHMMKGGVLMGLLWWCWTARSGEPTFLAVKTLFGALLAVGLARGLQNFLPMRPRPLHDPDLQLLSPAGFDTTTLAGWSSMPSDHALLFFALSTALWAADRRAGLFAGLWSLVVICLPRIYLGYHYPSDIVAGALIGIALMLLALRIDRIDPLRERVRTVQADYPRAFVAATFMLSLEIATLFEGSRRLVRALA